MATGDWKIATSKCQLAMLTSKWQIATGKCQLANGNSQVATRKLQVAIGVSIKLLFTEGDAFQLNANSNWQIATAMSLQGFRKI